MCIYCKSIEEDTKLIQAFHKIKKGIQRSVWYDCIILAGSTPYYTNDENFIYRNYYTQRDYTIYNFDDVDLKN